MVKLREIPVTGLICNPSTMGLSKGTLMFRTLLLFSILLGPTTALAADSFRFGDNSSKWARDGECDDRRFFGKGMSKDLVTGDIAHDAADCRKLYKAGDIRFWVESSARKATQCSSIKFGNNSSKWAKDGECDDPRFEGRGSSKDLDSDDIGHDAADCRAMCKSGMVFLRNY